MEDVTDADLNIVVLLHQLQIPVQLGKHRVLLWLLALLSLAPRKHLVKPGCDLLCLYLRCALELPVLSDQVCEALKLSRELDVADLAVGIKLLEVVVEDLDVSFWWDLTQSRG